MSITTILIYILFGFLIGVISNIILGYTWNRGFIYLVILGLLGIIVGHWFFLRVLRLGLGSWAYIRLGNVVVNWFWAIIMSIILVVLFSRIAGRRYCRR